LISQEAWASVPEPLGSSRLGGQGRPPYFSTQ
jgi:hypothetical protein